QAAAKRPARGQAAERRRMEALGGPMKRFGLAISGSAHDATLGHPRIDYGVAPVAAREPVLMARAGPSDSRCTSACQRAADTVGSRLSRPTILSTSASTRWGAFTNAVTTTLAPPSRSL